MDWGLITARKAPVGYFDPMGLAKDMLLCQHCETCFLKRDDPSKPPKTELQVGRFLTTPPTMTRPLREDGDVKTFRRRRESELKNGRVAMFATMGCSLAYGSMKEFGWYETHSGDCSC